MYYNLVVMIDCMNIVISLVTSARLRTHHHNAALLQYKPRTLHLRCFPAACHSLNNVELTYGAMHHLMRESAHVIHIGDDKCGVIQHLITHGVASAAQAEQGRRITVRNKIQSRCTIGTSPM